MAFQGYSIQGQPLEINVVGCTNLKDKEWFTKQDPYVVIEYGSNKFRTRTDTDGGKNPSFNEKITVPLIEGLREINASVWNSNTLTNHDHIGSVRILIEKAVSTGYDDSTWTLKSLSGRSAGELKLIIHYANVAKPSKVQQAPTMPYQYSAQQGSSYTPAPLYTPPQGYQPQPHHPPAAYSAYQPPVGYPAAPPSYPPAASSYSAYPAYAAAPPPYPPTAPPYPGSAPAYPPPPGYMPSAPYQYGGYQH